MKMIILLKGEYKLARDEKDATLLRVQYIGIKQQVCPCCLGKLKQRDSRKRMVRKYQNEIMWLQIHRMKCIQCGRLHSELPDCVIPQKQYSAEVIKEALEKHLVNKKSVADVENSTISRWYKWFRLLQEKIKKQVFEQKNGLKKLWHYFFVNEKRDIIEKIYHEVFKQKDKEKFYLQNLFIILKILCTENSNISECY